MRHISIKCRSYKWKFTMLCVLLAAISCLITVNFEADATGSRNLTATQTGSTWTGNEGYRPYTEWYGSSTGEIPRHQILKVYVNANETLYLGSSVAAGIGGDIVVRKPDGTPVDPSLLNVDAQTGIGYIDSRVKELAGPICPGGDTTGTGYKPLSIPVDKTGVWEVEFHSTDNSVTDPASALTSSGTFAANQHTGTVAAWDITVVKDGVIIPGRVFANFLSLNMGLNAPGANVLTAAVYVLTNDGYVYKTSFNGMDPFGFIFFANNRGLINANLNTPLYQSGYDKSGNANMLSVDSNGIPVQYQSPTKADTLLDSTYKIFFEQPANDLPPDIKTTAYAPGTIKDFKFMGDADSSGFVGVGGYFYFTATKTSSFQIKLDFTNSGTNTGIVYLANACVEGVNRVFWDGKDANGVVVPAGTYGGPESNIRISIIAKAGEYHFPMLDVEGNKNGIKIEMISNPLDAGGNPIAVSAVDRSTVYYNNSFVDAIRNANPTTQNMLGGMDSSTGASKYYDAQGNVSALDIWTYYRGTPSQNPEVSPSAFVLKPSEDKANVRGFVFYDTDQNGQYKMIAGDYSLSGVTVSLYSAGVLAATTTTDTTGLYSFSGIAYGEYEVRIVKPYDYAVCTTTIAVPNLSQVLTANNNGWTRMADVGFMYAKTDKMISVSKLWAVSTAVDKTQPTSVTVSVIGYNNAVPEVTKTILLSTTNGWKYSFSDLPKYAADGVTVLRYQVEEEPIAGYIQDIISADLPGEIKYTLTNSHKGQILLTKVDSNDPSRKLEGATFEFWRKGDSTPIDTVTTDENGEIYKSGLTAGTYYFKEITAPVGYTFESADAVTADIVIDYTDAGNSKSVTVKNTPHCNFTLTKTITAASDMDEQFLFEITGPTGSYYYAVITIPKGQTSASQKFTGMPVGTYNVVEKCSNWRYSIQTASTYAADGTTTFPYAGGQLSMLIDKPLNTGYQFAFVDSRTVTAWVSDHSSVTNTMVKPVMVPVVTPTVTPTPTVTVIPTVIPTVVPTVIPTVVPTVTVTPPTPTPPAVTYVRVSSITDGGTYVIVAQNVSGNYALTSAVYKSHYLSGVSVTVTGNNLAAEDVTNAMLWTFKADGNGYDVMNGTNYLNRKTTSGGTGLTVGAEGTADVSDWEYLDAGHYLYTTYHSYFYDNYYDMYQIANPPGPYYFGQGTGVPGTIYLYKRVTP